MVWDEQGAVGDILLALLILIAICLVVVLIATCYLYNVCDCFKRIKIFSPPPPYKVNYRNYMPVKSNEETIPPLKTSKNVKLSINKPADEERKAGKVAKLPIYGISDGRKSPKHRMRRPDSTLILSLGRITFSLKYNEELQVLHVNLICGRQLMLRSGELARMPVVKLNINGEIENEKQSSLDDTPNPEFDEIHSFQLSANHLGESILNLIIWDSDPNMFKTLIGFVRVPLASFMESLSRPSGTGPITREIEEHSRTDIPILSNGEVLFSLSYTSEQDRLAVAILKCRGVVTRDDVTDLFITVSLCVDGHEVESKDTSSIENFKDDIFNEMITFEPCFRQDRVTKDNLSLKLTLYSQTLSDEKRVVGHALVGPKTGDEGISHWREMQNSVRTAIAQWHRLIL
eukprot:gene16699-18393_t